MAGIDDATKYWLKSNVTAFTCDGTHSQCFKFENLFEEASKIKTIVGTKKSLAGALKLEFPLAEKKRIGNKRKVVYCGLNLKIKEEEISKLFQKKKKLEKENDGLKKSLNNYQKKWISERKEKEQLEEVLKESKEFYLPPCFFLKSINLEQLNNSSSIGSGAFGNVELRMFKGKTVAVKLLVNESYTFEQHRNMLLREAKVMVNLRCHSGLPSLVGICTDEAPVKLAMDFYSFEGGAKSLYAFLKENIRVDIDKMHITCLQIADGLHTIHMIGYLHNDLKLDNVVMYGNRDLIQPVIIDFNCSCKIGRGKVFKLSAVERENYKKWRRHIAPELVDGRSGQSTLSDIRIYGPISSSKMWLPVSEISCNHEKHIVVHKLEPAFVFDDYLSKFIRVNFL